MRRYRGFLIAVAVAVCLSSSAGLAGDAKPPKMTEAEANIRKKLQWTLPKLQCTDIPLGDVLQFLRDASNLKIEVDWSEADRAKLEIGPHSEVTLTVQNASLECVLRAAMDSAAGPGTMDFVIDDGRVLILPKAVADKRFLVRLAAESGPLDSRIGKARLAMQSLADARRARPANPARVASADKALRRMIPPILADIDKTLARLDAMRTELAREQPKEMDVRVQAVTKRRAALAKAIEAIVASGRWEADPPKAGGKRRVVFRPDKTTPVVKASRITGGRWTAEGGALVMKGQHAMVIFGSGRPAAGDIDLQTTLRFTGKKARALRLWLDCTTPGRRKTWTCGLTLHLDERPNRFVLTQRSAGAGKPRRVDRVAYLPPLTAGKGHPLRLAIRRRTVTCCLGSRAVSVAAEAMPTDAKLTFVILNASVGGGTVTLSGFEITGQAGAEKPRSRPADKTPRATDEKQRRAANQLKLAHTYFKAGARTKAKELYEKIVKDFPHTRAAVEAAERLKGL